MWDSDWDSKFGLMGWVGPAIAFDLGGQGISSSVVVIDTVEGVAVASQFKGHSDGMQQCPSYPVET